ncbi:Clp amino terminal domain-containing protein, pathogenicity island component [Actinokineospora alba]|uniref:Clp amino terminal domain-containing protein, pathogenicity island component n=1 Tax=Actinokineospora alba TaxID=504798 RepID=A0A1H0PG39_9PSEU|nr:Clp protease N-terminal domain-containing protein [Actinokineospora alba]TDP65771.1 ClpA/ClpB-like protein [Actinokineospora alba]SDI65584.1 Clp amino terminal domain-containing protein, pathogenicity island component [Actinokineospora alba]SDP03628.1 Clp amino terminal domain-containing protein, pathogenicity island component [Actinokineospora alba]
MFERFTKSARVIVRDGVHLAEQERAALIRPEHFLLAMLKDADTVSAKILAAHGVTTAAVTEAIAKVHRRGGLSQADTAALSEVGIDVDAVVEALESAHGEGALAPAKRRRTFGPRWRVPIAPESKKVIEGALREALARKESTIGDQHVLLALLAEPGVVTDILADFGVTHRVVSAELAQAG